ncbi:MAG TPA: hypothetical protein VGD43_19730, partial [Micromonospora sp.]
YLAGTFYSAETLTWAGHTRLLGISGRLLSPHLFGREELVSFPVRFPDADLVALEGWVARVLDVAGHTHGFAHVEFVLTGDGPEVVEVNARIAGALVGEAMCRTLGTNVYTAMVEMALGRAPTLLTALADPPRHTGANVMVLVYPDRAGTFTGMVGVDGLAHRPGTPQWYPTMAVSRRVDDIGDQRACTGLLLAAGDSTEVAIYNAVSAASSIRSVMD